MFFFIQCLVVLAINLSLHSEEFAIPEQFKRGEPIEQLILISDVDGVIREGVEAIADPRVISAIKSLLEKENVEVAFISGTPIENDLTVEPWRRGNLPLSKVFGSYFAKEIAEEKVTIFGVLGGHRMKEDGSLQVVDEYSPEISCELGKLLIHAFLKEVLHGGDLQQKAITTHLQSKLDSLEFKECHHSANATAQEFDPIVSIIRSFLDPNFRLISNGALIETQTSSALWGTTLSSQWLQQEVNQPYRLVSSLAPWQKQIATGLIKRGDQCFNYFLISKTNKGLTTKMYIEEKMKRFPRALVVTIGDTQVDFPMHKNSHLAFHVGLEKVWQNNPLRHCIMVRDDEGTDSQHVEGTLKVLDLLEKNIGKSLYDLLIHLDHSQTQAIAQSP